ncbi:MAG: hypothetical protein A2X94_14325 [Bdellovibrionales bacterium GWB1_55_8]|nr:MAG: hypothetical protein A2X94_14325 [Bdellovibrionales bacterium GWB1_55_8]
MATLDSSIVNIALPTLTKDFGVDIYQVKWVVVVYLLVITCLLLPFGRLSDQYGRKRVFQLGFLIFTIGSGLCGLSSSLGALVAARIVQGLGVSMLMANGPAIITAAFPFRERGAALGTLAMVVSTGLLSGPSVGGFLISHFSWPSIFWINIPIGIAGIGLAHRFLSKDRIPVQKPPFDWIGAFLQIIFLLCFIVVFDPPNISISGNLPLPAPRWIMAALTVIFGAAFLKVEADAKAPIFDLSLLKNTTFWSANLAGLLMFVGFSAVFVLMPFFLEEMMKFAPQQAGLYMTAIPATIFVVAPISGRLSDRIGSRWLAFAGALIGVLGLFLMSGILGEGLSDSSSGIAIILGLASMGLATGLFQSPNNNAIMCSVPSEKLGVASALLATVRNLGLVTGTGLATSLFTWRREVTGDFISAMQLTYFIAGILMTGAIVFSLWRRGGGHHPHPEDAADPTASGAAR